MNIIDRLRLAWAKRDHARKIARHGWTGVYVGDYHSAPTWAYTIGFDETLDHPELVVFDLTREDASAVFCKAYDDLRAGTLVIEDGLAWPPAAETSSVWRKVHPDHIDQWLTFACMRRYDKSGKAYGLEAFQLVLTDNGILPWETGYDERLRELQPALYEPPCNTKVAANGGL